MDQDVDFTAGHKEWYSHHMATDCTTVSQPTPRSIDPDTYEDPKLRWSPTFCRKDGALMDQQIGVFLMTAQGFNTVGSSTQRC